MHGDESVIPTLWALYVSEDAATATAACVALEYLGTSAAIDALTALAGEPAGVSHRAALVDTLAGVGTRDCVPVLLQMLDDHRPCEVPSRADATARRVLAGVQAQGDGAAWSTHTSSRRTPQTLSERAAAALRRITGLAEPFSSAGSPEQQAAARRVWTEWYERGLPTD